MYNFMAAFIICGAVVLIGEIVAKLTKAWVPSVFVSAVVLLLGYWTAIPKALYEDAHYRGVFMYEVKKAEFPQLNACYDRLYEQYVQSKQ